MKSFQQVLWSEKPSSTVREDQIKVRPRRTSFQSSFRLVQTVLLEHLGHILRQVDHPLTVHGFGVTDAQLALLKVEILPLEREQFSSSHPGCQGKDEQRFLPMTMCDREELVDLLHVQWLNFKALSPGRRDKVTGVARDEIPAHSRFQSFVQHVVKANNGCTREALLQFLVIKRLKMLR